MTKQLQQSCRRLWLPLFTALVLLPGCSAVLAITGAPNLRELRIEHAWVPASEVDLPPEVKEGLMNQRFRPSLVVDITTSLDLRIYGRDYDATFWLDTSLCRNGRFDQAQQIDRYGEVFMSGEVPPYADASRRRSQRRYRSYLVINFTTSARSSSEKFPDPDRETAFVEYDMRRQNNDICFVFSGGPMWFGAGHRSREFVLPYAVIAEALARAGLPHAEPSPPGAVTGSPQ